MERAVVALAEDLGCQVVAFARKSGARVLGVAAQAGQALKISLRYQSFFLLLGFYPPQRKEMWSPEREQLTQLYLPEPVTREKILEDTVLSLTSLAPLQVSLCESEQLS